MPRAVTQAELALRLAELKLAQLDEGPDADEVATARASLAWRRNLALPAGGPRRGAGPARAALAAAEEKYRELQAGPSQEKVLAAQAGLNARLSCSKLR